MKTPVLYCIFNRLDTVEKTFAPIRDAKPERLYISADGPRSDREGENELTEQVRKYVLDNIDWECDVKTLFREENLGCDFAISGAIEWFFSQEEEGIVIEDDVLTSPQFFEFCELMLETYRDNPKIRYIAGYNPIPDNDLPESYYFIPRQDTWGWAAWRRSFYSKDGVKYKFYPYNYYEKHCNKNAIINQITKRKDLKKLCFSLLFKCYQWDSEFSVYGLINHPYSYAITPGRNLTSHIGDFGFHFQGVNKANIPINDFNISNLKIRENIVYDKTFQESLLEKSYYQSSYLGKYIHDEVIDTVALKKDFMRTKIDIPKTYLEWLYYRFIKFRKKRAAAVWEMYSYHKLVHRLLEPFYIYVTKYYNK